MALESLCGIKQTSFSKRTLQGEDDVDFEKDLMMSSNFQVPISINVCPIFFNKLN